MDKALIYRKLSELETYLQQIKEYSEITAGIYRGDWKTQRIIERTLQMMIETCADISGHIAADSSMRPPTGYADSFRVLLENRVISPELSVVMEKMAKFRNIVVHQYEQVDAEIVVIILRNHLVDFIGFKDAVLDYVKGQ